MSNKREYPIRTRGKIGFIFEKHLNLAIIPFPFFLILIAFDSLSTYNSISE